MVAFEHFRAVNSARWARLAVGLWALAWATPAFAATGTWSGSAGATWTTGTTNWSNVTGTPWDSTNGPSNSAVFNTAGATPTVSGTVWVNAITFSNTANISGGTIALAGSGPTITASANATIASILTGSAGLTKAGNSTLTLAAANTYTGNTSINGGGITLDFSGASSPATNIVATTSTLTMGGTGAFGASSALNLSGKASTVNSQTFNGLTLNAGAAAIALTANVTANPLLLSVGTITRNTGATLNITQPTGTISGSNGLITTSANSSGILGGWTTVGGANWAVANSGSGITAFSGYTNDTWAAGNNTTVTTGTTVADGATTNSLRFSAAGANTVTLSGSATISSGGILVTTPVGNNLTQISGGSLRGASGADLVVHQYNTSNGLTIGSIIADNGSATGLTKTGGGAVALSAANTFSGDTRVNSGTLTLGNVQALQNSTFDTQIGTVGTLSFGVLTSSTFGNVEGSNALSLAGVSNFTFGGNNQATALGAWFSGVPNNATVTKTGTGLFTVGNNVTITSGQTLNIDGPMTINGFLQLGSFGGGTTSTINHTKGVLIANLTNGPLFIGHSTTGIYNLSGGTIDLNGGSANKDIRLGNQNPGANGIFNLTSGTILGSNGALNIAFRANTQGSYSQSGGSATFGTVSVGAGGSGTAAATVSGGVLTATTLNVATTGTTVGGFTLSGSGTLNLGGVATVGTGVASTGTLNVNGGQVNFTTTAANITAGANGVVNVSGGSLSNQTAVAGTVVVSAPMTIGSGGLMIANSSGAGRWLQLSGNLSGTGGITVNMDNSNTFVLTGSNTFAGGITSNTGYFGNNTATAIPIGAAISLGGFWGLGANATIGSLTGSGLIFGGTTAQVLTVGYGNTSSTFAGTIQDNNAIVKTGSGTLTLSGAVSQYGGTTINGGRLAIASTGALSGTAGSVTINGGELKYNSSTTLTRPIVFTAGTISGTGTIGTAVTAGAGDILSPGNSPGTQSYTSGLTLGQGGQYTWEINNWAGSAGSGYDQLAVSGSALNVTATSGSTFTIAVTGVTAGDISGAVPGFSAASGTGTSFTIATSAAGITNFDKTKFTVDTTAFTNNNSLPTSAGFWLTTNAGRTSLILNYAPSATRSLAAATSAAQIIVGGTATITAGVINAGNPANSPDALSFTGLAVGNGVSLGATSGSGITAGGTSATSGAFTTLTAGTFSFTPSVATATNTNIGTNALTGSTSAATVTVLDHATSSLSGTGAVLSAVLDLGTWDYGSQTWTSGSNTGTFFISNLASLAGASLTADLSLTNYTANSDGFSTNLSTYADILGAQSSPFTITFDPTSFGTSGTQTKTFTLTMADKTGLSGGTSTNTLTVTANVVVVPEPGALAIAGIGTGMTIAGWFASKRRRMHRVKISSTLC
jgi:fibronectin-binding autotransporter adhesin